MPAQVNRETYFDAVRGLSILAVVGIHATAIGKTFSGTGDRSDFIFYIAVNQLLLFAVPLFFFISGFFTARSLARESRNAVSFYRKRLARIAIPYVFWSLVFSLPALLQADFLRVASNIALGTASGPYYFLFNLLIFSVLTPLVFDYAHLRRFLAAALFVSTAHLVASYVLRASDHNLSWWYFMIWPSAWCSFYAYGLFVGKKYRQGDAAEGSLTLAALLLIITLASQILEAFWLIRSAGANSGAFEPTKISSHLYAFAAINFVLVARSRCVMPGFLAALGSISFGVFLLHEPLRARISKALYSIPTLTDLQPVLWLLIVLTTVVATVIVIFLAKRLSPKISSIVGL